MLKVNGHNIFANNVFSWASWSADVLQSPKEVRDIFNALDICEKTISTIKAVGYAYNLASDRLADDDDQWLYADDICFPCRIVIDEPLIISLGTGDRLEIEFSEASSVRISKNCLPVDIKPGVNANNVDAAKIFSCCLGETILGLEITTTDVYPFGTGAHGIALPEGQDDYIESFSLLLSNYKKIKFEAWFDYGLVAAINAENKPMEISFANVKLALLNSD